MCADHTPLYPIDLFPFEPEGGWEDLARAEFDETGVDILGMFAQTPPNSVTASSAPLSPALMPGAESAPSPVFPSDDGGGDDQDVDMLLDALSPPLSESAPQLSPQASAVPLLTALARNNNNGAQHVAHAALSIYNDLYLALAREQSSGALSANARKCLIDVLTNKRLQQEYPTVPPAERMLNPRAVSDKSLVEHPLLFVLRIALLAIYAPFSFAKLTTIQQGRTLQGLQSAYTKHRKEFHGESGVDADGNATPPPTFEAARHHAVYYWLLTRNPGSWPWVFGFRYDADVGQLRIDNRYIWAENGNADPAGAVQPVYRSAYIMTDTEAFGRIEALVRDALALADEAIENVCNVTISHAAARDIIATTENDNGPLVRDNAIVATVAPELVTATLDNGTLMAVHRTATPNDYYSRLKSPFATIGNFIDHFSDKWKVGTKAQHQKLALPADVEWIGWLCSSRDKTLAPSPTLADDVRATIEQKTNLPADMFVQQAIRPPYTSTTAGDASLVAANLRLLELNSILTSLRVVALANESTTMVYTSTIKDVPSYKPTSMRARPQHQKDEFANTLYSWLWIRLSTMDPQKSSHHVLVLQEMRRRLLAMPGQRGATMTSAALRHALIAEMLANRANVAAAAQSGKRTSQRAIPPAVTADLVVPRATAAENGEPTAVRAALFRAVNAGLLDETASPLWAWTVVALTNFASGPGALDTAIGLVAAPVASNPAVASSSSSGGGEASSVNRKVVEQLQNAALKHVNVGFLRIFMPDGDRVTMLAYDNTLPFSAAREAWNGELSAVWQPSAWLTALDRDVMTAWSTPPENGIDMHALALLLHSLGLAQTPTETTYSTVETLTRILSNTVRRFNTLVVDGRLDGIFSRGQGDPRSVVRAGARMLQAMVVAHARIVTRTADEVLRRVLPVVLATNVDEARSMMGGASVPVMPPPALDGPGRRPRGGEPGSAGGPEVVDEGNGGGDDDGGGDAKRAAGRRPRKRKTTGQMLRLYGGAPSITVAHVAAVMDSTTAEAVQTLRQMAANARASLAQVMTAPQWIPQDARTTTIFQLMHDQHVFRTDKPGQLPRIVREIVRGWSEPTFVFAIDIGLLPGAEAVGWFFPASGGDPAHEEWPLVVERSDMSTWQVVSGDAYNIDYASSGALRVLEKHRVAPENTTLRMVLDAMKTGGTPALLLDYSEPLSCEPNMHVITVMPHPSRDDITLVETFITKPSVPDTMLDFGLDMWHTPMHAMLPNTLDVTLGGGSVRNVFDATFGTARMEIAWMPIAPASESADSSQPTLPSQMWTYDAPEATGHVVRLLFHDTPQLDTSAPGIAMRSTIPLDDIVAITMRSGQATRHLVVHLYDTQTVVVLSDRFVGIM